MTQSSLVSQTQEAVAEALRRSRGEPAGLSRLALAAGGLLLGLLVAWPFLGSEFWLHLMTTILLFGVFAMSLDFLMGYLGAPSVGHGAFFGLGAYGTALTSIHLSSSLWLNVAVSLGVAALAALAMGFLTARSSGIYFLMLTLALGMLTYSFAISQAGTKLAGGFDGLPGVARPTLDPLPISIDFRDSSAFYFLVLIFAVLSLAVLLVLVKSPFGRTLIGIRENEARMRALGYVTWHYRLAAFVVGGSVAGAAGGFFALQRNFTSPDLLHFNMSAIGFILVIIGGSASLIGPFFGAAIYVVLQDYLSSYTERWQIIFGAIFIIVIFVARDGVVGLLRRLEAWVTKAITGRRRPAKPG